MRRDFTALLVIWGLRDYGTARWEGGDEACDHTTDHRNNRKFPVGTGFSSWTTRDVTVKAGGNCPCGARRIDLQIGLEPTPESYVATMVGVFREVRRVLRDDGTVWLNLGDSYAGSRKGQGGVLNSPKQRSNDGSYFGNPLKLDYEISGLKPKDLCGIPWRVAFALQQPWERHTISRDVDRAWLAAFIDGEGTIGIRRFDSHSNGIEGQRCQDSFVAYLSAGNNDRELLEHCVDLTGYGKVGIKDEPHTDGRGIVSRRTYFGWRLDGNKAIATICDIYPFLIAKRKQAVLAYNLDLSNKNGKALRGNGPLPASEQEKREYLKTLINQCNQREPVDIPSWCIEPKTIVEPGWYLRSDIIWHKPNPMPESVTDRPTRSHEYIFLLAKSQTYFYDADAIREPLMGEIHKPGNILHADKISGPNNRNGASQWEDTQTRAWGNEAGRNKRSVWTVNSEPTPSDDDFDEADYVGENGRPYKASPDCPIHAPLVNRRTRQKAECGEQLTVIALRSLDSDCRLAFVRQLSPASRQHPNNGVTPSCSESTQIADSNAENRTPSALLLCGEGDPVVVEQIESRTDRSADSVAMQDDSSDSPDLANAQTASASSKGSRKKPRARTGTARGIACVETDDDIARIRPRPFDSAPDRGNGANKTLWDDSGDHLAARTNARIADNPSFLDDTCKCRLSQQAHFATFPQKLIEPCILAGSSEKGCCSVCGAPRVRVTEKSTEFHGGSGAAGRTAEDVNANGKWAGKQYGTNIKLGPVVSVTTTGWRPSCAHDAPSVPCVVLDPFLGSGTVGKVSERLGRRWVGLELSEPYIDIARNRTAQAGLGI